jgi:hypothetical protein
MIWNYRVVNLKSQCDGEDWYKLQEVSYDDDGKPTGYGDPCIGSDTYESFVELFKDMITHAVLNEKPLQEEDFE